MQFPVNQSSSIKIYLPIFSIVFAFSFTSYVAAQSLQKKADDHHANSQQPSEGIVLGLLRADKMEFASAGLMKAGGSKPSQTTLFEIGSITKVFTAVLLAETVREKKLNFSDQVSDFLPKTLTIKDDSPLHKMTLESLATHHSGLPRLPSNLLDGADPLNPYVHYDKKKLYSYLENLSESDLNHPRKQQYSNFGFGLLGHLLELVWEKPYPELVREKIFHPLAMDNSFVPVSFKNLPPDVKKRLATGHHAGKEVPHWELGSFLGVGAIISSSEDLLKFAHAHWADATPSELAVSLKEAAKARKGQQGLAWIITDGELSHNGGTGGFVSSLMIDPVGKIARVRLMNSSGESLESEATGDFSVIKGFWEGTLEGGPIKLGLVFYITSEGRVIQFSLDQGSISSEAAKTSVKGEQFRFSFPGIGGSCEGKMESDKLIGIWKQSGELDLVMTRTAGIPRALKNGLSKKVSGDLKDIAGYWSGFLGGKNGLFVYVRIEDFAGSFDVTFHSPDQSPVPLFTGKIVKEGSEFSFTCPLVKGKYQGTIAQDGESISGIWNQGRDMPLNLKWSKERSKRK